MIKIIITAAYCMLWLYMPAQKTVPKAVAESLTMAGSNRAQLEKVIKHYAKEPEKLKAAYWLIENMRWHKRDYIDIIPDSEFLKVFNLADSLYYNLVKGKTIEEIKAKATKDSINGIRKVIRPIIAKSSFNEPRILYVEEEEKPTDLNAVKAQFLIDHIDNAFAMLQASPHVKKLNATDFFNYLLSYRTIDGQNFRYSGKDFNRFFAKYLGEFAGNDFKDHTIRYNLTVGNLRNILGNYPFIERAGFEELFFTKVKDFDCFDISNYAAMALNACGLPLDVEFNTAYQLLQGKHSMCRPPASLGKWDRFSPESGSPGIMPELRNIFKMTGEMNVLKIHFAAQKNTPYFLKAPNETIPYNLSDPCIEDITSQVLKTVELQLPFNEATENNLCYLATFNSATGIIPITWTVIDKKQKKAIFKNAIPDRLYFPVYYEEDEVTAFGLPFLLQYDSTKKESYNTRYLDKGQYSDSTIDIIATRKFPRKPNMAQLAKNLTGTLILAADSVNGKVDTLHTINFELQPYFQDIELKNGKAYKYYRIQAPDAHPQLNLAEVQFLTEKKFQYTNTNTPWPLPIFSPSEKSNDTTLIRLMDEPLEKLSWKSEYDGKMETAPGAYKIIHYKLESPQIVTHVRLAPLNANNGIVPGNEYQLRYWDDGRWNDFEYLQTAAYNYVEFKGVPKGKLYWLKNLSGGKEELPFMVNEKGEQQFLYFDIK